jgi:hypothetical protein
MLSLLIHKIVHLFSSDKSPEGLENLDRDIRRDITGLRISAVMKVVGIIVIAFAFLFLLLWVFIRIFQ